MKPALAWIWLLVIVPVVAMSLALVVTPSETIQVAGQSIEVGAAPPSLTWSGPGELDLFGRPISTRFQFDGPIRPRLRWSQVSHYNELISGLQQPDALGGQLVEAWHRYFLRELIVTAILGLAIAGLSFAVIRRRPAVAVAAAVVAGLIAGLADGIAIGAVSGAVSRLPGQVSSLEDIVGRDPLSIVPAPEPPPTGPVDAVVIGDSTAAGAGNPVAANASATDRACRRSPDAYAFDLARVNHWHVLNLACTNATIADGLFGTQRINGVDVPPQLSGLQRVAGERAVLVSIGANEMHWANLMELCLASVSPACDDAASSAWFQQTLDGFTVDYYDLLVQLAALPGHPRVIVNEYYAPLPPSPSCPDAFRITAAKAHSLLARLEAFNSVLRAGAAGFGFESVQPSFAGHELCSNQPYVQGPGDPAPLHPNAAGELAIALADQQALSAPPPPTPTVSPTAPASASP
jgi:hypothetical protein